MTDDADSNSTTVVTDAAGHLAREVSGELVRPLRGLRETLALAVEKLDNHMSTAKGPTALSWHEVDRLRQQLADAYLQCRALTRLASELADVSRDAPVRPEAVDINKLVDHSLNLARHKISATTQVFVDHGVVPLVRGVPRLLILAIVAALTASAESAATTTAASVSLTTRCEPGTPERVLIKVCDDGGGARATTELALAIGTEAAQVSNGDFNATSESAKGCVFELRLPTGR